MTAEYTIKDLDPVRLVALTATLDATALGDRIGPMFDDAAAALGRRPGALALPIATYEESTSEGITSEDTPAPMNVVVGYGSSEPAPPRLEVVELPPVTAVCGVHLGPVDTIRTSWDELRRWLTARGYHPEGPCREVYVRAERSDQSDWITELQQPIAVAPR